MGGTACPAEPLFPLDEDEDQDQSQGAVPREPNGDGEGSVAPDINAEDGVDAEGGTTATRLS